ncbi:MAG: ASKHA domain-containing protein [Candidatus Thorarchaeota archaeon]
MNEYGLAIDLGTTRISMSIVNIRNRECIRSLSFDNPQNPFGDDVISRIKHQVEDRSDFPILTRIVRNAVAKKASALLDGSDISKQEITEVVLVGNTAMHHIFYNLPVDSLIKEPYVTRNKKATTGAAEDIGFKFTNAVYYSPPIFESFVGSDAMAVILGFGMSYDVYPSFAIDIGTNSEIILQYYSSIWVTSAASGPAFEGMSLDCGVRATDGAIDSVKINRNYSPSFTTLGAKKPIGICGAGAISALNALRLARILSHEGSLNRQFQSDWLKENGGIVSYIIAGANETSTGQPVYLNQVDIRMLQQSKASIRAAIEILLCEGNCGPSEIKNLYLTGAFGSGLDVSSSKNIDMFPHFQNAAISQRVGGALSGAEILVWSEVARKEADNIAQHTKYVDLMNHPNYDQIHSEHLFFP